MTEFAYDRQLAAIPDVVKDLVDRNDYPALDPTRPILFAGIGTSLHAARVAADWVAQLTQGRVRAIAVDAHDLGAGAFPLQRQDQVVVISHRGTKVYPTASLERARSRGCRTIAVVGAAAPEQPADITVRTCANEVAGTFSVSYLASLVALARIIAATFPTEAVAFREALSALPNALRLSLAMRPKAEHVQLLLSQTPILISGFGADHVTAQEAALKIKEGAWLWTEAMSPEFAIHGTPASYTQSMSAILMMPDRDDGGRSALLTDVLAGLGLATVLRCGQVGHGYELEFTEPPHPLLRPLLAILPFHVLTAELARSLGTDPDTLHGNREPWRSVMTSLRL
jgi:glutamine---fructose-6-phosphate transaminase (isomerizing)